MTIKKYNIKVNGKAYEVEVEEVSTTSVAQPEAPIPQANQTTDLGSNKAINPTNIPKTQATGVVPEGKEVILAPLPGKIMAVKVEIGQNVQAGDLICILEAMKMENELYASINGTVKEILVAEGTTVAAGESLVVIS